MKNIRTLTSFILPFLLLAPDVFALVDYTDKAEKFSFRPIVAAGKGGAMTVAPNRVPEAVTTKKLPDIDRGSLKLKMGGESVSSHSFGDSSKLYKQNIKFIWQTSYGIYLDTGYWQVSKRDFAEANARNRGNPTGKVGLDWFRWGAVANQAALDLFGGYSHGIVKSDFASSRNDIFMGIETTKRFGGFAMGIQYEYVMTGTPASKEEVEIGDIQKMAAGIGWMVSDDISFGLEGALFNIAKSDSGNDDSKQLGNGASFGYLSPKLLLQLGGVFELEMGGVFRTKRFEEKHELVNVRLLNYPGAHGNSIFANLGITI